MRITVIGGGIVGLCCALELHRAGAEVRLFERGECGRETSRGNAGWIVPAITEPVAAPGMLGEAARWLGRADTPLRVNPGLDPARWRWCARFWREGRPARHAANLDAMLALNDRVVASWDRLRAGLDFEMYADDFLVAALTEAGLARIRGHCDTVAERGYPEMAAYDRLDGAAMRALEPALSDAVIGGLRLRHVRRVRPETVTRAIRDHLAEQAGVSVKEHTPVQSLRRNDRRWGVETAKGTHACDAVVVAAGLGSNVVLDGLCPRLPLQGARGHSITGRGAVVPPSHGIKLAEAQVAVSAFADGVRISGTWDLVGNDAGFDARRLRTVIAGAGAYLRDCRLTDVEFEWAGLRPSTPDSLPLIGPVSGQPGLNLATGHGMYGVTYGPLTGSAIADIVLAKNTPDDLQPCRPSRYLG